MGKTSDKKSGKVLPFKVKSKVEDQVKELRKMFTEQEVADIRKDLENES